MGYVAGFVTPVPAIAKDRYRDFAETFVPVFREFGAVRMMEAWGDDVPDGETTDLKRAVKAEPGEIVVFSWQEFPDKATYEDASSRMMSDPRLADMGSAMPFDGGRMIFGGFEILGEDSGPAKPGYVDGALLAVPAARKAEFEALAAAQRLAILATGALRAVDAWGDFVPAGTLTDFRRAVKAEDDEIVVFSWVEWPSKAARDAGWASYFSNPAMMPEASPFDEERRAFGGFVPIVDAE